MAIDTIDRFLAVIRRLGLLAPEQADQVETELGPHYHDPLELAHFLVDSQWLTTFQFDALFEGRWDELTLGPYQILSRLGAGGVSDVFKAWDTVKGRTVALKVLRQGLTGHSDALRQFERELDAVQRLNHPNVIKTWDAHQVGAMHYFAMEYVEGTDLKRYIQEHGPLPVDQACDYVRQVALGLQHAHQHGLVHRDIKPANLLLVHGTLATTNLTIGTARRPPDPQIKILDWGLARVMHGPGENSAEADEIEKGLLIGTADYIAPEQASDPGLVDTRADLYSLGCTLYCLLTGQPPFNGTSLMQKLLQHREGPPPSIRLVRSDVPPEVEAILLRLLAKKPEARIQIPLLLVAALRHFCPRSPAAAKRQRGPPAQFGKPGEVAAQRQFRPRPRPPARLSGVSRPSTQTNLNRSSTTTNPAPPTWDQRHRTLDVASHGDEVQKLEVRSQRSGIASPLTSELRGSEEERPGGTRSGGSRDQVDAPFRAHTSGTGVGRLLPEMDGDAIPAAWPVWPGLRSRRESWDRGRRWTS